MRLRWTEQAVRDLTAIRDSVAEDRPGAARKLAQRILEATVQLEDFPRMGRPGRVAETRELVVSQTPYLVAYRIQGEFVELLRVIHGAQKWPESL